MSEYDDPAQFSHAYTLRDGTPVVMRAVRPDDMDKLVAAFHALDPQSIYTRFHSPKKELSGADLELIRSIDFVHSIMLVVTRQGDEGEIIIGGVSCFFDLAAEGDAKGESAEIAFTVEEDYQGQGLAGLLLRVLVAMLRKRGTAGVRAEVLADNLAMLKVFERSGLPVHKTRDGGVVHVELSLQPSD
ncbi:MAG: GNAT family N-acetyltransferase [Rubrivivax sp.]